MKIALITDTHWGARGDNEHIRNNMVEFYRHNFFPTIEAEGVNKIIHLGDLVDRRKYINYSTLKVMQEEFIDRIDIPTDIIVGNHDTYYKNTNELNALDEIIGRSHHSIVVFTEPCERQLLHGHEEKVLYLPWITPENAEKTLDLIDQSNCQLVFGHLEILGFEMMPGQRCTHGIKSSLFDKFGMVYSGHFHLKSQHKNIQYLGSPYEMNWTDAGGKHGFHILDTNTMELEYHHNGYTMFEKIFYEGWNETDSVPDVRNKYVKVIVKDKPDAYQFDSFIDTLQKDKPIDLRVVEPLTQVDTANIVSEADDTATIINNTIEGRIDIEDDMKVKVKKLMADLYIEASQIIVEK